MGIECTSGRLDAPEMLDPFYKIDAALASKATKPYASPRVALAMDVTNLYARSLAAGGNLMADGLEGRLATGLSATPFGAIIATVQAIDDAVRPRRFSTYPRRIESSNIDPALREFLAALFPIQPMHVPLAWIPHQP